MTKDYRIFAICLAAIYRNEYYIRAVLAEDYDKAVRRAKVSVMRKYGVNIHELTPVISHSVSMEEVESQLSPAEDRIKLNEIVATPSEPSEKDKLIQSLIKSKDMAQIEQHDLTLYEKKYIEDAIKKESAGISEGIE